jgi:hypothetical protein
MQFLKYTINKSAAPSSWDIRLKTKWHRLLWWALQRSDCTYPYYPETCEVRLSKSDLFDEIKAQIEDCIRSNYRPMYLILGIETHFDLLRVINDLPTMQMQLGEITICERFHGLQIIVLDYFKGVLVLPEL